MVGHGISVSRTISGQMSEADERHYIRDSVDRLKAAIGTAPTGWLGPESGESARTPQLLAQTGRLLVLNLHPWLIGQPFQIGYLDAALGAMVRHQGAGLPPAPR
jgi:peptidoglycan/xylan/chitin deacetylase (PgdA/CDA1 family)